MAPLLTTRMNPSLLWLRSWSADQYRSGDSPFGWRESTVGGRSPRLGVRRADISSVTSHLPSKAVLNRDPKDFGLASKLPLLSFE